MSEIIWRGGVSLTDNLTDITYYVNDVVSDANITYIATAEIPIGSPKPSSDMNNWNTFVSGAIGTSGTSGTSGSGTSGTSGTGGSQYKYSLEAHVDPTGGRDGTSGTSGNPGNGAFGLPFKTINYAVAQSQQTGLIELYRASYDDAVLVNKNNITIQGHGQNSLVNNTFSSTNAGLKLNNFAIQGAAIIDNPGTIGNHYRNIYFNTTLSLTGTHFHEANNIKVYGNATFAGAGAKYIYDSQFEGTLGISGAAVVYMANCSVPSITVTEGLFFGKNLQGSSPASTITIGAGVVYLLSDVSGYNLSIHASAIKYEDYLISQSVPAITAKQLASNVFSNIRLTNVESATGQTQALVLNGTSGLVGRQTMYSVPTGGTSGQFLMKNSTTSGDASWKSLGYAFLSFATHRTTVGDFTPTLVSGSGITVSGDNITFVNAGTYLLQAHMTQRGTYAEYAWVDTSNATYTGTLNGINITGNSSDPGAPAPAAGIVTVAAGTVMKIRLLNGGSFNDIAPQFSKAWITQLR